MIVNVPLTRIQDNPWNTRAVPPTPEDVKELALDIANNGLMQKPAGRLMLGNKQLDGRLYGGDGEALKDETEAFVQLAFGHTRRAAYEWLNAVKGTDRYPDLSSDVRALIDQGDWSSMPIDVRQLTDVQMADQAWSENERRRQHTPLDRATAIQRRIQDFGWSQAQVAEHLGISRPVVSNSLRLLKLPEKIIVALGNGEVTERVAMALVSLFDLPQEMRQEAEAQKNYYSDVVPSKIVSDALAGNITSDVVRKRIDDLCQRFSQDLSEAVFSLDEVIVVDGGQCESCRDCEQRFKERNRCLLARCFKAKTAEYKRSYLEKASQVSGIPPLETDRDDTGYGYGGKYTHFKNEDAVKVIPGKCGNLRLRFEKYDKKFLDYKEAGKTDQRVDGFIHARIVCGRQEQHCTCLTGLAAAREVSRGQFNPQTRDFERHTLAPVVQIGEQTTADELKAAAQAARREKRAAQQEAKQLVHQVGEMIAGALLSQNGLAWREMAGKIHYKMGEGKGHVDATEVATTIGKYLAEQALPYDIDRVESVVMNMNGLLKRCGLDELPLPEKPEAPAAPADEPAPVKTLVEIFAEEEVTNER
jgi:ParB-like chromosome segregation protein Spo0J